MWAIMKQTCMHCMCMSSLIRRLPLVFPVPLPLLRCPQPERSLDKRKAWWPGWAWAVPEGLWESTPLSFLRFL